MNLLKDVLSLDISHLQNICNMWELTPSDIKDGYDGEKFHDGLESVAYVLENSIKSAIFNKGNKILNSANVNIDVSDMYIYTLLVENHNNHKDVEINSLQELLTLIEEYK